MTFKKYPDAKTFAVAEVSYVHTPKRGMLVRRGIAKENAFGVVGFAGLACEKGEEPQNCYGTIVVLDEEAEIKKAVAVHEKVLMSSLEGLAEQSEANIEEETIRLNDYKNKIEKLKHDGLQILKEE